MAVDEGEVVLRMREQYGDMMRAQEAAEALKYKDAKTLGQAVKRGHVSLTPIKIAGEREFRYTTEAVAHILWTWLNGPRVTLDEEVAADQGLDAKGWAERSQGEGGDDGSDEMSRPRPAH